MIVVAIIGILAAIAIPAYQNYAIRAQVTEGMNLAGAVKAAVAESLAERGTWPLDLDAAGVVDIAGNPTIPEGKYVSSIAITTGTIVVTYGNQANAIITADTEHSSNAQPQHGHRLGVRCGCCSWQRSEQGWWRSGCGCWRSSC